MADNNNSNNNKRNVTGSYPGVTGTYKSKGRFPTASESNNINVAKDNSPTNQFGKITPDTAPTEFFSPVSKQNPQQNDTVTGYPTSRANATGSYVPKNKSFVPFENEPVKEEQPPKKEKAPKPTKSEKIRKQSKPKEGFDWKMWFSGENVKGFLIQIRFYGLIVLVAMILTWVIVSAANDVFAFIKTDENIIVTIPEGSDTKMIAAELDKAGIIERPMVFRLYCKLKKADGKFQFGEYSLNSKYSYDVIISKLKKTSTQAELVTFTIPEGATQDDIVELLTVGDYTNITELEHALNSYEFEQFDFLKNIPDRRCRLEGYLPAGDYEIYKGESAVSIVTKMLTRFKETMLTEQNLSYITATGKTLDELVTTASLVQAECSAAADYKNAASVLANRLSSAESNYLMLTCTINYVLPQPKATLAPDDKLTTSTYNTYTNPGLPTGPVTTPSPAAFEAVINPVSTGFMYFISDGDKTTFSATEEEHKAALKKASATAKGTDVIK